MKRSAVHITVIYLSALVLVFTVSAAVLTAQTRDADLVVDPGGEIQSIKEAVDRATPGDRIEVLSGRYEEYNLLIDKPLEIIAIGEVEIDGMREGSIFIVHADDVTISGFRLRNTGRSHVRDYAAVLVEQVSGFTIENNQLEDIFFGIYLAETEGGVIRDNTILSYERRESASGNGIHLWNVKGTEIRNNRVEGQRDGIYLEFAEGAVITGNHSTGNNRYGLHFMFSDNSVYEENRFDRNGAGVAVMYSSNVDMRRNLFEHNWGSSSYGLLLKDMNRSRITENRFYRNTVGIYTEGSTHMDIRRNDFELNGWAVKIRANSRDNLFTENNFIENSFDVGSDSPRNPNRFEGNYWSHYDGYDLNRDGVGDVPYRPVRLFSMIIERRPEALILLRSMLITLLDTAERVMPVLTPATLVDEEPRMERIR